MRATLTFVALGAALASTLLLGPLWGIALGGLAYIVGNNVLLTWKTNKLEALLQERFNEIPKLVSELVEQRLLELKRQGKLSADQAKAPPEVEQRLATLNSKFDALMRVLAAKKTPPSQKPSDQQAAQSVELTSGMKASPLPELERRLSALDSKFEKLETKFETLVLHLHLLAAREVLALQNLPKQRTNVPQEAAAGLPGFGKPQDATAPASSIKAPQAPVPNPTTPSADLAAEIAAVRGLLENLTTLLADQGKSALSDKKPHVAPAEDGQNSSGLAPRPTMDQLRTELDRLALELRSELEQRTAQK